MTVIALVSCVKMKSRKTCRARDLYISPLFQYMRKYAEQNADEWRILSAMYGLLDPREIVQPYELTLNTMSKLDRVTWAKKVRNQIKDEHFPKRATIIFLAGKNYREFLHPLLEEMGYDIRIPMEDMKLGAQLQWLKKHTSTAPKMKGFGIV